MTLEQLKSKAYDLIVQYEIIQNELKRVNQEIIDFKEEKVEEEESK